jgi:hypothetical protein
MRAWNVATFEALLLLLVGATVLPATPLFAQPATVEPIDLSRFSRPKPFRDRLAVPVRIVPQSVAEPPRNVPAAEWKSPYCTEWSDGLSICKRDKVGEVGRCAEAEKPGQLHAVACRVADLARLSEVCFHWLVSDRSGRMSVGGLVQENWIWRARSKRWNLEPGEDDSIGDLKHQLTQEGITAEVAEGVRTFYCLRTYAGDIPWKKMKGGNVIIGE